MSVGELRRMRVVLPWVAAVAVLGCSVLPLRPAWDEPPVPIRTGTVVDGSRLHRGTLDNGLELLVFEDDRLPLVSFGLALRRGAASESLAQAGLATFTAALLERGAGERDALALAREVDDLGASLEVGAGWDAMTVVLTGLSRDLDPLWAVLGDVALRPRFDAGEAEKVRGELLAALEAQRDEPRSLASREFFRALYAGHRFGLPSEGVAEAVASLRAADARSFHEQVFVPGNAILFAAGAVNFADVRARAEATFDGWAAAPVADPPPPPPSAAPTERRIVVVDRPDLGQAQVLIGHEGMARTDPDRLAAGLMNRVLGQAGFSSRLISLRKDRGLAYSVYSYFALRRAPGPFLVVTATRVPAVREAVDLLLAEVARMRSEPPTARETEAVKRQSAGRFVLSLETSGAVVDALVDLDVHGLPADSLDTYGARIAALTEDDLARAARERLHPGRAAIVVVGPAEQLRPQLDGLGTVEVVEP